MKRALDSVNERILAAIQRRPAHIVVSNHRPRLVAVSKLKPISSIIEAYECGQRHFGENYIQELEEKSNRSEILAQCPDIKFHFIGHLQSNKVTKILKVRNLYMLETIDSIKLANLVDRALTKHAEGSFVSGDSSDKLLPPRVDKLKVMIQVNTSGEEQKNGVQPAEVCQLAEHIVHQCRWLELAGVMTIGKFDGWPDGEVNKDFSRLYEVRDTICKKLTLEPQSLELSMGMSGDFEEAIIMGSSSVRVGTLIFGERPAKTQ